MGYVFLTCIWNGANFYIDKFAQSYSKQLQEIASTLAQDPSPGSPEKNIAIPEDKKEKK
jgi:MinD-like ATPase involved in chromosome partitioning or flagellar assembly